MSLRPTSGNMYDFVTHTWNVIKGKCSHDCVYCYMKQFPQKELRFDEKELKRDLGSGKFIFVGSSTDMFANNVPWEWIQDVLAYCGQFDNKYLFQSKNPSRFKDFDFPEETILCTTIEANGSLHDISKAPHPIFRAKELNYMSLIRHMTTMVTIEPILKFDLDTLSTYIQMTYATQVNIGADSQGHNLPEPTYKEVMELVEALSEFTTVKLKKNLERLRK